LASDISIFVGANNSGKTSATQAIHAFVAATAERISLYDFSAACWSKFDEIGGLPLEHDIPDIPSISLDLWFEVEEADLHLVVDLVPSTEWQYTHVGMRIEFASKSPRDLLDRYQAKHQGAKSLAEGLVQRENEKYVPWPESLTAYLRRELHKEFEFKYYILDRARFDADCRPLANYVPLPLGTGTSGAGILKSLIRVDSLSAQRHLADPGQGVGRAEDLSRRLSRFYKHNLDQREEDHSALRALYDSELGLNAHLADVFKGTIEKLYKLGYPGLHSPKLQIRSAINPATIMSQDTRIHYVLGDGESDATLPDSYNGLGFKNLIYMVVEVLDAHARWVADKEHRALLHLIFIEEPEAHLHAQLQQVFIRNVLRLVQEDAQDGDAFRTQAIVTTHSPHILYERGFQPIRYFRRVTDADRSQTTDVLNLSAFYANNPNERDFLERYLKLTHCDLFFADAAILVEGNVERLLLPVMIERTVPNLTSACLCILEVGGAFGHKFKSLLDFLGLVTLVITDLDSVEAIEEAEADDDDDVEFEVSDADTEGTAQTKRGKACLPSVANASTSNQTLIKWLPAMRSVRELLAAEASDKIQAATDGRALVRVCYQVATDVKWQGSTISLCGRTFEESFGLENADWCQHPNQKQLKLKLRSVPTSPSALAEGLHKRVKGKSFDKTNFALEVLMRPPSDWQVPLYIREGLEWLNFEVSLDGPTAEAEQIAAAAQGEAGQ
jgi:predicted ATP-dependent endonuclease of OLD family